MIRFLCEYSFLKRKSKECFMTVNGHTTYATDIHEQAMISLQKMAEF